MILFLVSGHGYGHATRSRSVIDSLRRLRPDVEIHVRTAAPAFLFGADVRHWPVSLDPPVVESADALSVDGPASAKALRRYLLQLPELVQTEAEFVRAHNIRLIVADIPFVAGFIAEAARVPAVAIGNFTWDWIFETIPEAADTLSDIRDGYKKCELALRLPLCQVDGWEIFPEVTDVPLVTPRSSRSREEIASDLRLQSDPRTRVLIAGRAPPPASLTEHLASSEWALLDKSSLPDFHELVRVSDIVVSKLGYSTAAECIAEGTALLYPPRSGFREDGVMTREVPSFTRALPIPRNDWEAGNWAPYLRQLVALPRPVIPRSDGAGVCARILAKYI